MEVIEIISNFINKDNNVVEVIFRMSQDDEDTIREDTIEFEYLNDFGYGDGIISSEIFEDIDDDWGFDFDEEFFISNEDLKSFLNEYYIVYEDRLPNAELN